MTFLAQPRQFTLAEFEAYVQTLSWDKGWKPAFLTGHNTAAPRLSQYLAYSPAVRRAWPANLNNYYRGMGWHSGPHAVVCPDVDGGGIWLLCDPEQDGVSVSCWNHQTFGIENLGDYETEDPTTGHGAEVRDQFVGVAAALCKKLNWTPRPQVLGVKGIHWHKQCARDGHPCPGKNWDGDDVISRIEAALALPSPAKAAPLPPMQQQGASAPTMSVSSAQTALNKAGARPQIVVDGVPGNKTRQAIVEFQNAKGLFKDGLLGAATIKALQAYA